MVYPIISINIRSWRKYFFYKKITSDFTIIISQCIS